MADSPCKRLYPAPAWETARAGDGQAYDGELLETWKEGRSTFFAAVDLIFSYRYFILVADDGDVDLGPDSFASAHGRIS